MKMGLYRENKRIMKKKTTKKKSTPDLVYNESFTFKVPRKKIEDESLLFCSFPCFTTQKRAKGLLNILFYVCFLIYGKFIDYTL